jgi:hypothetical protein
MLLRQSRGFRYFTMEFHLPFYVLKQSRYLIEDTRGGYGRKHLRRSWRLPFLSSCKSPLRSYVGDQCLYEAQISVTVTGIDHRTWTAYGFLDTYYGSNKTTDSNPIERLRTNQINDPLSADRTVWNELPPTPREYFFRVFETRIRQVRREWRAIIDAVEKDIARYVFLLDPCSVILAFQLKPSISITKKTLFPLQILSVPSSFHRSAYQKQIS